MPRAHLYGTPVSPGIALGTLHFLHTERFLDRHYVPESEVACEQELLHKAAHKGILQAWRLRLAWCRARLASYKVPQRDSPGLEVETQSC